MNKLSIDYSYTLFLDRDGVINKKIENSYVLSIDDLEFMSGVFEALPKLTKLFERIIIVTNQQCIGKGLLHEDELRDIHTYLLNLVELNGGRIDAIYIAPDLAGENNNLRKPNIGMALLAKTDFPEIDFQKSLMIGDSESDMQFGKQMGMTTIYLNTQFSISEQIDYACKNWQEIMDLFE